MQARRIRSGRAGRAEQRAGPLPQRSAAARRRGRRRGAGQRGGDAARGGRSQAARAAQARRPGGGRGRGGAATLLRGCRVRRVRVHALRGCRRGVLGALLGHLGRDPVVPGVRLARVVGGRRRRGQLGRRGVGRPRRAGRRVRVEPGHLRARRRGAPARQPGTQLIYALRGADRAVMLMSKTHLKRIPWLQWHHVMPLTRALSALHYFIFLGTRA